MNACSSEKTSISSLFCTFLLFVWEGLSQTGSTLSFIFTRPDYHMTIITLIQWIKKWPFAVHFVVNYHDWQLGDCPLTSSLKSHTYLPRSIIFIRWQSSYSILNFDRDYAMKLSGYGISRVVALPYAGTRDDKLFYEIQCKYNN